MKLRTAFFDPPNVDLNPNDGQPKGDVVQQIVTLMSTHAIGSLDAH